MSDKNQARRTDVSVFFAGTDITSSIQEYLISLNYTDNEDNEADDLQISLQDRSEIWLEKWLNTAIQAAALRPDVSFDSQDDSKTTFYKVTAQGGLAVRSRGKNQYFQYGTLAYGTVIEVSSISGGWANFTYSGKNAYVNASYLQEINSGSGSQATGNAEKGLQIQAMIVRKNWDNNGNDDVLDCGQFELDSVEAQGPPDTVTIKGTSLPYKNTVRQTKKSKSWENYTLSGIANEIASKNGMTCMFLSDANPSYERVEQYLCSDIAFLQKLCQDSGCSLKVSNNIIVVFDQAAYEKKTVVRTIKRGKDGGYTKYKLSTGQNDTYTSCRVSYVTSSGTLIEATAYADDYDEDSEKNQCLEVKQKISSVEEAKALAEKMLRLHNKFELTATFTFPGDPKLLAGCVVELVGWGAWNGKYIIKQAKHQVGSSGYTTQITLRFALAANTAGSGQESTAGASSSFSVGDKVMCNAGIRYFYDDVPMSSWVPTAVLYVRAIEQNGSVLLVSTEPNANVYTGRVNAADVHKL